MAEERLLHEEDNAWRGEHYYRYKILPEYIEPTDNVLDIACGTGYGTHRIAGYTNGKVIGGDISAEAVESCSQLWKKENLSFRVLDGTRLDFPDGYFDKVVSFETIEHTTAYMEMLKEFSRVLKDNGIAIISTPNFLINSPKGYIENPYHTQEFVYDELDGILKSVFEDVMIYGQKYSRYDKPSKVPFTGRLVEGTLKIKGIRKLPLSFKNRMAKVFIGKTFYPDENDFRLVSDKKEIVKCPTFFCICRKKKG
ncbi:MAG TPA: class I SAM-dependent methyltransferase [Chitinophagaceae bacterium]|nr:class I SAM-dependent methyltransferase [Chitinophagaceae bacterium]